VKIDSLIQRWGLLRIFALSGFVSIIGISIASGSIYFSFLQQNLLKREMTISVEFIQSVSLINNPEAYFEGSTNIEDKQAIEEFFHQLIETQRRRIKQASSRAVELNEQNLRRIGSELHDGPVQSIGFALLKLDSILEPGTDSPASANSKTIVNLQCAFRLKSENFQTIARSI